MSHQATTWVMEFSESQLAARLVLGAIAHRVSNDSGEAYPSIPTIAREANVSESTVYEALDKLYDLGEVDWEKAASPLGTNLYRLPKFRAWMETLHPPKTGGGRGSEFRKHNLRISEKPPPKFGPEPSSNHQEKPSEERTSAAAPPGDPRHPAFVNFAIEDFRARHGGQTPTWNGKDFRQLADLLGRNSDLQLDELKRRWTHYVSSPQQFIRDQGESLAFFCSRFDSFIDGPLPAAPGRGGKTSADERDRNNFVKADFQIY